MRAKIILLMCCLLIWLMSHKNTALAENSVNIPDPNLKAAIEEELGISDPNAADMLKLTFLSAYNRGIDGLTGLEYATNLMELYLHDNQISDISLISGLVNLTRLSVYQNQISDITAISELVNITKLYLSYNLISDISALSKLTNLAYLDLRSNPLNSDAFDVYIPQIVENNPDAGIMYDPYVEYSLILSSTDGGSVTVPGEGSFSYPYGGIIPVTANASPGYHFLYWTGSAVEENKVENIMSANTTINLKYSDYTLQAIFVKDKDIIYVDDDSVGTNDGSSWQNAYIYLQDALADAEVSEKPVVIRVADGIYKPDQGNGIRSGDISATFNLICDVTLSGGYAGIKSFDPNARDIEIYQTILSGDLQNNDNINDINDHTNYLDEKSTYDNSVHILTANLTDTSSILEGFWIMGGNFYRSPPLGSDPPDFHGGGMVIIKASPTISNCIFTHNAALFGGAIAVLEQSNPNLINCLFERNESYIGGGVYNIKSQIKLKDCLFISNNSTYGAGLYLKDSDATINNSTLSNNTAYYEGGGIYSTNNETLTLKNCKFRNNSSDSDGGGMHIEDTKNTFLSGCLFTGNYTHQGSAISNSNSDQNSFVTITNCTFAGNSNNSIGTARVNISYSRFSSYVTIKNSIIWNNIGQVINNGGIHAFYSNLQGGWEGYGNIDIDPFFVNPGYWIDTNDPNIVVEPNEPNAIWIEGDYHLKSQSGRWNPNTNNWVQDDVTSPCIDAGDPNSPIGLEPFPNGGYINMGAYGGTSEASKSYFGKPLCETIVAGDINGDCKVDQTDMDILMIHWLEEN